MIKQKNLEKYNSKVHKNELRFKKNILIAILDGKNKNSNLEDGFHICIQETMRIKNQLGIISNSLLAMIKSVRPQNMAVKIWKTIQ